MDSFSNSYLEARGKFLTACAEIGAHVTTYSLHGLCGESGENLATDVACVGPDSAERVALVISGTHGSEGFCGSAIQTSWLARSRGKLDNVKVVLVHAINPWAFSHRTRSDQDNIDINRNFIAWEGSVAPENPAYDALAALIHGDPSDASRARKLYLPYRAYLDQHGWHLENEIWQGQWHRPDGIMYGGRVPAWSNVTFRQILRDHLFGAKTVGFIDWHTGVGQFGETVHLIFNDPGSSEYRTAVKWWDVDEAKAADAFQSGARPDYNGLLCQAISQELSAARITGAVVEFGTADHYSVFRADILDRWLRFEGHGHPDARALRDAYSDICCPRDISWRRFVEEQGASIMDQLVAGVATW